MSEESMRDQTTRAARDLTIAHVTNLSDEELPAFAHAVALARQSASALVSIHANDDPRAEARMPRASELLSRWAALPAEVHPGAPLRPDVRHRRVVSSCCDDTVDTLLRAIEQVKPELLVAATGSHEGLLRVLLGSVAGALALQVRVPTLLVPLACRPFVHADSGHIGLARVLVAAGDDQAARAGLAHAQWLSELGGVSELEIELLHVTDSEQQSPTYLLPERSGARIHMHHTTGSFEEQLRLRANAWPADLIVVATRGHDSLRDVLVGSHAERVLHHAPCPVLSVPLQ